MPLDDVQLHFVENTDEAMAFKRWLGERHENNLISVDTETTGFDPNERGAAIRLIQFGDTRTGWSIPWQDWRGVALEAMREWEGMFAAHNLAFEYRWLAVHSPVNLPRDRSVDTMIAAHIHNPLEKAGLKPLASKYVDRRAAAGQNLLQEAFNEHGWTWATVPVTYEPYHTYAALDTVLTSQLWDKYRPEMTGGGPYRGVFDLEMAVRFIVSAMEHRGARIDMDYSKTKMYDLVTSAEAIEAWCEGAFGINIQSVTQLGAKLVELGGELFDFTPTGKPKVDKYTLKVLADPDNGYPVAVQTLAQQALYARRARKFASAYFSNFIDRNVDGFIHADIRTLGARTARMSVGNPALQQIPKDNALVRNAFIPRDGNVLVTCDSDQIEARLLANFADDPGLREAFRVADDEHGDFFVQVAKRVYGDPTFQKSDKRRSLVKSMVYGLMYGAGTAKMAETAGVPVDRMQVAVDGLTEQFPGIRAFMSEVESKGVERERKEGEGYVVTPIGRRLPADKGKIYALCNYVLQSTAADVLKKSLVKLDASGWGDYAILPVHDEVVFDMPKEFVEQALRDIPILMSDMEYGIPLTASAEGPFGAWGQKYA